MMTSKEQDTDPSTPGAMRGLSPTDPTPHPLPASAHVSTDPGIGPPSQPPMAAHAPVPRTTPSGIVVPASSGVKPRKDSVELLLDGMRGPQPERPKTMPQTDGQASASYHVEHQVHAARTSPDEVPKVVVERLPQAPTTRIDRARVQAVIDAADAHRKANEATAVLPQQIAPRVIVALVAGGVVVLGLFVVLRLMMGSDEPPAPVQAKPAAVATVTGAGATPVVAAAAPTPSVPPPAAASEDPPVATAPAPRLPPAPGWAATPSGKPRAPRAAPAGTAGSADLGDLKTTYH